MKTKMTAPVSMPPSSSSGLAADHGVAMRASRTASSLPSNTNPTNRLVSCWRTLTGRGSADDAAPPSALTIANPNVLEHFLKTCPEDVFAYCGRFLGAGACLTLMVDQSLRETILSSSLLWWLLCEDSGKLLVAGDLRDLRSTGCSYKSIYDAVPCVPIDFSMLQAAITHCPDHGVVVVKPGVYVTDSKIQFASPGKTTTVIGLPSPPSASASAPLPQDDDGFASSTPSLLDGPILRFPFMKHESYETVKHDEPLIHVGAGTVTLQNLILQHHSPGQDMWNGNSCVHVKPLTPKKNGLLSAFGAQEHNARPTLHLRDCSVRSTSGRGVVCMSSDVSISNTEILHCAATGVYLGGARNSRNFQEESPVVTIDKCDIVRCGGGTRAAGHPLAGGAPGDQVISAGHSGIYCEQGTLSILNSNVSANAYTGIHGVNPRRITMTIKDSCAVGNGGENVVLPPVGTDSRERCTVEGSYDGATGEEGRAEGRKRCAHEAVVLECLNKGRFAKKVSAPQMEEEQDDDDDDNDDDDDDDDDEENAEDMVLTQLGSSAAVAQDPQEEEEDSGWVDTDGEFEDVGHADE